MVGPCGRVLARLLVQHDLAAWSFDDLFIHRVERAAENLVTHAVATTGVTEEAPLYADAFDDLQVIVVRLRAFTERVVVEVWDHSNAPPDLSLSEKPAIADAEEWGYDVPLPGRRVVWCAVAAAAPLPRRTPMMNERPRPVVQAGTEHDTAFLSRLLDGVRRISNEWFDGDQNAP